jgi:hypothetical protein
MFVGRPLEAVSNGGCRWMAAGPSERVHRTRPTGQLARRLTWGDAPQRALSGVVVPVSVSHDEIGLHSARRSFWFAGDQAYCEVGCDRSRAALCVAVEGPGDRD